LLLLLLVLSLQTTHQPTDILSVRESAQTFAGDKACNLGV